MAEWFFRKKSKSEVEHDPAWVSICLNPLKLLCAMLRCRAIGIDVCGGRNVGTACRFKAISVI